MTKGTRTIKIEQGLTWNELRQVLANDRIGRFATFQYSGYTIQKVGFEYQMWKGDNYVTTVEGCDNAAHWLLS